MIVIIVVAGFTSLGLVMGIVLYARNNVKKRKQREYESDDL